MPIEITKDYLNALVRVQDIREYSNFKSVKNASDDAILANIRKSLVKIQSRSYIGRSLIGVEVTDDQVENLKIAVKELAVSMITRNADEKIAKGYKSEKLDDYSYTIQDGVGGDFGVDIDYLIDGLKLVDRTKRKIRIGVI